MTSAQLLALAAALGAALAFGAAAVLQGIATRREPVSGGLDPALLVRLARQPAFLVSLALNLFGFVLHVSALQYLPLFLVQSVIATSVAVTAVLSVRVFGVRLTRLQWWALAAVVVGLALLAPSADGGDAPDPGARGALLLLAAVLAAVVAATAAGHLTGPLGAVVLGLLAGVGFGVVAVAARLLPDLSPAVLLRAPAAYVLAAAGAVAFLLYSAAMHRGSVTTSTAAMVITQTALPAVVGAALLGDEVRDGFGLLAVVGFVLALAGALGLARFEAGVPQPAAR